MSEEAPEIKTKKKGKLPVILALVAVIGGGGFFAMKGRGAHPKPVVKAGAVEPLDKEFLVNLASGPNVYLRAELALELRDGFTKEALDAQMPAIRDGINQIFRSKTLQQVGASSTPTLQREIATMVNQILIGHMSDEQKKAQKELEESVADESASDGEKKGDDKKAAKNDGPKWACPAGPVLNVYFTSFTTQ